MPDHEEAVREAAKAVWRQLASSGRHTGVLEDFEAAIRASERAKYAALVEAADVFDRFYAFVQAAEELGHVDPLTEHTCVASLSVGGASDYLWVGNFMKLRAALAALQSKEGTNE